MPEDQLLAYPVSARPAPRRRDRHDGVRPALARVLSQEGAAVREPGARRRNQPRAGQSPVGAARGDAGKGGDDRWRALLPRRAVPRARDAEPDRARRHLSAPGGAARPLHAQGARRLPDARCGKGDRRAHGVGPAHRIPAHRGSGRHPWGAKRDRRALHGPEGRGLHRGGRQGDARAAGDRLGGAQTADRLRRLAACLDLSGASRTRARLPARAGVCRARGRQGDGVRRAAASHPAHVRSRGGGRGHRPRDHEDPRGGRGAVKYEGPERRKAVRSPVQARRRAVTTDVLKQVKGIELRTRNLVSTLFSGEYRSVFRGQGIEFAEVRAYQQGDDFRAIDWNVSARMGHPFVKTFHEEREITLLLVVDQSGSCQFGRPYTKAGLAVEVAAVLALAAARHNDRVGALMFADKVEFDVRPAKGRPHALRVIRDLVAFRPRGRGTNPAEALRFAARLLRHRSIVAVLSDFRAEGWEEPLGRLAADHDVVAITTDDRRELDLPDAGWVDLQDAETGRRGLLDPSHGPSRTRLRVAAERHLQERSRKLIQAGVDRVELQTQVPYSVALRRAFAARARRLRR